MKSNIRGVLKQFKNAKFLDPLFEAIANALDAGAKKIEIELLEDEDGLGVNPKPLLGYSVTDDGEGFTKKNRAAFSELYTDNRKDIGGKGSGRFKALVVFDHVDIDSCTGDEHVSLRFTREFDDEDDFTVLDEPCAKRTTLTFLGKGNLYTQKEFPSYSAKDVLARVFDHFLPRIVLLGSSMPDGSMTVISHSGEKEHFLYGDIHGIREATFKVRNVSTDFTIRSCVLPRPSGKSCAWFCANNREVEKVGELSGIEKLQGDYAIVILVSGAYLDENVNEDRTAFAIDKDGFASLDEIGKAASERAIPIVKDAYPRLDEMNEAVIQAAIDEAPALARYIRSVSAGVVLRKDKLLESARKSFLAERDKARDDFFQLLNKSNTPDEVFCEKAEKVSEMAHIELAEYILYRQAIIDAFAHLPKDPDAKEKRLHSLLMPMRTEADDKRKRRHTLANLWLLDDRFMTYTYAASDIALKRIAEHFGVSVQDDARGKKRPDLFIFFDNSENCERDALIVELKGANATLEERNNAITELPRNIAYARSILGSRTNRIWGYIITKIDDSFAETLDFQNYTPLVNVNGAPKAFYTYLKSEKVQAYVTVLDVSLLATDANARNKTFMDILKG